MQATYRDAPKIMADAAAPEETGEPRPSIRAWYALAVLGIATVFGFVDRQILVLMVEPLKHDLHIGDFQIGTLQGLGPALFAALAAVPLGWMADRFERRTILIACVLLWSAATAACGLVQNFSQLFLCTIAIAIGEAALSPIVYSAIPDLFPGSSRIRANFLFFAAVMLGAGLGLILGGAALSLVEALRPQLPAGLDELAGWRIAFFLVALPGVLIAACVASIGPIARQTAKSGAAAAAQLVPFVREHWRSVTGVYAAAGCAAFAAGAASSWLPAAIVRALGAQPQAVGIGIGVAFAGGSIVGLAAAVATLPLWKRLAGSAAVLRALQLAMALAIVPTLLLAFIKAPWQAFTLSALQMAIVVAGTAYSPTLLQDMTPPALRARLIAFASVIYVGFGAGSPMLVGALSDVSGTSPRGLLWAMVAVAVPGFTVSALLFRLSENSFRRTVASLNA